MNNLGIKVKLIEHFSIVRESLDRIGLANKEKKTLIPLCYILHKTSWEKNDSEYYIIHYKNLKKMDGELAYFTKEDEVKEYSITKLLEAWGLIEIIDEKELPEDKTFVFVLPFKEKEEWEIKHKYKIGQNKDVE